MLIPMPRFTLNGKPAVAEPGISLLRHLRGVACLTAAKNACGEGACGACTVLLDGRPIASCVTPVEKVEGKSVVTLEGPDPAELSLYSRAYAEAGAVQCGFCTPGMILATKALLDENPSPSEAEVRAGLRRNLCRCTGYQKIVAAVLLAASRRREAAAAGSAAASPSPAGSKAASPASAGHAAAADSAAASRAAAAGGEAAEAAAADSPLVGASLVRIDAVEKAEGRALFVDDLSAPRMLFGAVLRAPHPRARLLSLDAEAARRAPGVAALALAADIPGRRFIGHIEEDWPTLMEVGEESRCVGDAVALVAAESPEEARAALGLIRAEWEVLPPLRSPAEALARGAPAIQPGGNILSRLDFSRGDADSALAAAAAGGGFLAKGRFSTPFTDHAFMEPESALAFPPDDEGVVLVRTGEQNVFDGRRYVALTLGLPEERVRVVSAYVGGGFGGKEDQTVQHHAALLACLAGRPVKLTFSRQESILVHPKRHAMEIEAEAACDAEGRLTAIRGRVVADTGAYASLGGPVLHRAVTHFGGPYACPNVDVEGLAVYTNNPPAGAFRGFGVPQVNFALESLLDELAGAAGLDPWEFRFRNAVRPGGELPNGQLAGPDTAVEECLLAVKEAYYGARREGKAAGLACGLKNTGIGVGHRDVGRCSVRFTEGGLELLSGAACIGQGLATVLVQVAAGTLGVEPGLVSVALPDTAATPDSGTTTASRQTLLAGEACRQACLQAVAALAAEPGPGAAAAPGQAAQASRAAGGFPYAALAGRIFRGEYEAKTDPFDSAKANPVRHVAYSYACHLAVLGADGRLERFVAAHDSGLVVNPLAFEGQVEGGVAMGLGYALTEDFPLEDCAPTARFGTLGLLRAADMPPVETLVVRKAALSGAGYGAKGIGEISSIPTASAVANAYRALDGKARARLPLEGTPYGRKRR